MVKFLTKLRISGRLGAENIITVNEFGVM